MLLWNHSDTSTKMLVQYNLDLVNFLVSREKFTKSRLFTKSTVERFRDFEDS